MINIKDAPWMLRSLIALFLAVVATSAEAAITFVADGTFVFANPQPASVVDPTGISLSDTLMMVATVTSDSTTPTVTTPAGWTFVINAGPGNSGDSSNTYLFYRVATSADVSQASYSVAGICPSSTYCWMSGFIRAYHGTASSSPISEFKQHDEPTNITTNVIPAMSTFASGQWYFACNESRANENATSTAPALSHVNNATNGVLGYTCGDLIPSSAPGAQTFTYTGGVAHRQGVAAAILPSGGGSPSSAPQLLLQGAGK